MTFDPEQPIVRFPPPPSRQKVSVETVHSPRLVKCSRNEVIGRPLVGHGPSVSGTGDDSALPTQSLVVDHLAVIDGGQLVEDRQRDAFGDLMYRTIAHHELGHP